MLKAEKKLLLWVQKHMYILMPLLVAAICFYLQRIAIWWGSPDVAYYFDGHEHNVQSKLYYVIVFLAQYLPRLPLHSVKWIAGLSDYIVALLCFLSVGAHREPLKLKSTFYISICIFSPIVFLRGVCWAQLDSLAFAFLLGAFLVLKREKYILAGILATIGSTLYPCLLLVVLVFLLMKHKETQKNTRNYIYLALSVIVASGVFQCICGTILGASCTDSLMTFVRWSTYNPYTGTPFIEPLLWIKQMLNVFGYSLCMISSIAAYKHKISYVTTLLIHLVILLVYASMMFPIVV